MAPVAATLEVTFISNFAGQHRVCWRIVPNLIYDCTTITICSGMGNSCTAIIPITVDNESCDAVTYEGYAQASCEDETSLSGRTPFSITFTPSPVCDSYRVTCDNTSVASITVTNPGTGYDPLVPPVIPVAGGGGAGATATPVVNADTFLTNGGVGYTPGVYNNVPLLNVTGTGTGALATITVAAGGNIVSFFAGGITTSGSGYFPGNLFGVNNATQLGGTGTGFEAQFGPNYGTITSISSTPGSGYTSVPTAIIPAPAIGITALATVVLAPCPTQTLGSSCNGSAADVITGMELGQSARACMTTTPIALPEYVIIQEGCCYDCVTVDFAVSGLSPATDIYYTDCVTHEVTVTTVAPGGTFGPICMVNNSWYWDPASSVVTVNIGVAC